MDLDFNYKKYFIDDTSYSNNIYRLSELKLNIQFLNNPINYKIKRNNIPDKINKKAYKSKYLDDINTDFYIASISGFSFMGYSKYYVSNTGCVFEYDPYTRKLYELESLIPILNPNAKNYNKIAANIFYSNGRSVLLEGDIYNTTVFENIKNLVYYGFSDRSISPYYKVEFIDDIYDSRNKFIYRERLDNLISYQSNNHIRGLFNYKFALYTKDEYINAINFNKFYKPKLDIINLFIEYNIELSEDNILDLLDSYKSNSYFMGYKVV